MEAANIQMVPFDVTLQFLPRRAALLNGIKEESRHFSLIGAGALGSQGFGNLMRGGFGRWAVIDNDRLLPHNLARHSLGTKSVGQRKAEAVCERANNLFVEGKVATPIVANVLSPGSKSEVERAFARATAVLDCSASVPVARTLALAELGSKRAVSVFLNPSADALVCLAEDEQRACRLDWLEMQYYREVSRSPALLGHLRLPSKTRYANACRSVTSRLSQEAVGIFAAIGSRAFREVISDSGARIRLWTLDDVMQVTHTEVPAEPCQ
jgi:hypothetical protein